MSEGRQLYLLNKSRFRLRVTNIFVIEAGQDEQDSSC